jgi:hypothetical protein
MIEKTFNPKKVSIGKDVRLIKYYCKKNYILKYFKNNESYQQTINFYTSYNFYFIPRLININPKNLMIKQEYVGNMISLKNNLPITWESQINNIRKEFIKNNIYIEDLRFLPYTPLVFNNITVKNDKLYIIDLTMVIDSDKKYINYKIDNIIYQIKLYLFLLKYINYIFLIIPHIFYHILVLILKW